jgi:hypothetical protein
MIEQFSLFLQQISSEHSTIVYTYLFQLINSKFSPFSDLSQLFLNFIYKFPTELKSFENYLLENLNNQNFICSSSNSSSLIEELMKLLLDLSLLEPISKLFLDLKMNSNQCQLFTHLFSKVFLSDVDFFSKLFSDSSKIKFLLILDFEIFSNNFTSNQSISNDFVKKFLFLFIIEHFPKEYLSNQNLSNSIFSFLNTYFFSIFFCDSETKQFAKLYK